MATIVVGTTDGLQELGPSRRVHLGGLEVTAAVADPSGWWAITEQQSLWRGTADGTWEQLTTLEGLQARCLLPTRAGVLVGTSAAHLFRLDDGWLEPLDSFEQVAGRADWYTPWGGPPDVRSIAEAADGDLYVSVHVGGVARSSDGGRGWQPTIDIDADVHQILAGAEGHLVAATARGLASSVDRGDSWVFETDGLHAIYLRAVG
ncbi:MAG: hypothetical protein M3N52_03350, partial [Actinomycetota bacterium]|nr:hypothetical protein [Actinomycetota bacterium]